jgi:hypothetical protein
MSRVGGKNCRCIKFWTLNKTLKNHISLSHKGNGNNKENQDVSLCGLELHFEQRGAGMCYLEKLITL